MTFFSLNELFLNNLKSKFTILGFEILRKDGGGGGVGIFIRTKLDYKRRKDLEIDDIEIYPKIPKSFVVGTLYRPPDSSQYLSKNFDTILSNLLKETDSKEVIILGDFNVQPTRVTENTATQLM